MPRPAKKRLVCREPINRIFLPQNPMDSATVILTVDEYETLRLIDLEGNTQEECAGQMHVSRATVQSVYNSARFKLADALVNGKRLMISGGAYIVCGQYERHCGKGCHKKCHKYGCKPMRNEPENSG